MEICTLPHFGLLDASALEAYYQVDITFDGKQIEIDLNFEHQSIEPKRLETVMHFIENIRIHDINNKGYIAKDYYQKDGETVKLYLKHHLEELGDTELAALIDNRNKAVEPELQLLNKLHLIRVGLYPDCEKQFVIFDYSLGREMSNYLLVINTDENGNLDFMTMES